MNDINQLATWSESCAHRESHHQQGNKLAIALLCFFLSITKLMSEIRRVKRWVNWWWSVKNTSTSTSREKCNKFSSQFSSSYKNSRTQDVFSFSWGPKNRVRKWICSCRKGRTHSSRALKYESKWNIFSMKTFDLHTLNAPNDPI